jgi:hypothetical protein
MFDMTDLCYVERVDFMTIFYIQGCTHDWICGMGNQFNSVQFIKQLFTDLCSD